MGAVTLVAGPGLRYLAKADRFECGTATCRVLFHLEGRNYVLHAGYDASKSRSFVLNDPKWCSEVCNVGRARSVDRGRRHDEDDAI